MMNKSIIQYFTQFITEERFQLFQSILETRTRYITIVLEDIFQPQNASAVVRSADCFGIHDVHIIENRNRFTVDTEVAMGSSKWINLQTFNKEKNNSRAAISKLKEEGYRIIATSPHTNDTHLEDFDLTQGKVALFFGTELKGISETVKESADEFLKIPMYGFTESLNISVSAAIIMHHLTLRMKTDPNIDWRLNEQEKDEVMLQWLRKTIKHSEMLEANFFKQGLSI